MYSLSLGYLERLPVDHCFFGTSNTFLVLVIPNCFTLTTDAMPLGVCFHLSIRIPSRKVLDLLVLAVLVSLICTNIRHTPPYTTMHHHAPPYTTIHHHTPPYTLHHTPPSTAAVLPPQPQPLQPPQPPPPLKKAEPTGVAVGWSWKIDSVPTICP
jgi:hypothetical protein